MGIPEEKTRKQIEKGPAILDPSLPRLTDLRPEQLDLALPAFERAIKLESWHGKSNGPSGYEQLYGFGKLREISLHLSRHRELLPQLRAFLKSPSWTFCTLSYDLKQETITPEKRVGTLSSTNPDRFGWPDLLAWEPEFVFGVRGNLVYQLAGSAFRPEEKSSRLKPFSPPPGLRICSDVDRTEYLAGVDSIRNHIREGDVYELNYCQEFYAELDPQAPFEPFGLYTRLSQLSRAPFSAYLRDDDRYVACASPERFLSLHNGKLISQPIKGTAGRGSYAEEDRFLIDQLVNSEKDRAENVMIVDLVRNDFARVCKPGTVKVPELFGRYTFPTVHHLISTVSGELRNDCDAVDALAACFPMGSMTGAPKIRALELIESHERFRRGLYSGSIGYFSPAGDFDFNVVIRSLLWNSESGMLSFPIGGAITWDSVAESEYAECLVKAEGIRRVLAGE